MDAKIIGPPGFLGAHKDVDTLIMLNPFPRLGEYGFIKSFTIESTTSEGIKITAQLEEAICFYGDKGWTVKAAL